MERLVKISFVVALVIYFVFSVAVRVPAQWATKTAIDSFPGLKLGGVSGTVWKGQASSASIQIQGQFIDLGELSWDVDAWSLLSFDACADVKSSLFEANVCRSASGFNRIQNLIVEDVPAQILNKLLGFAKLEGIFKLTVKEAVVNDQGIVKKMLGTLLWESARGDAGGGWFDLGSFMAEITENEQGGIVAIITDTSGDFALALTGEFTMGEGPALSGTIKPRPEAHQQIVDSLGLFTEALDDGSFVVTWPM